MEVAHARVGGGKDVGSCEKNEGQLLGDQLLDAVVELLPLG